MHVTRVDMLKLSLIVSRTELRLVPIKSIATEENTRFLNQKSYEYFYIFPNFQNCAGCEKDLKENKHDSLH